MKKLSSAELFRVPSNDFYILIEGNDFYSSGVFTIKKKFLSPSSSFKTKGISFDDNGKSFQIPDSERSAVFHYDINFEELVESALSENNILYRVQLSEFTRQGILYASYTKGFISLPAKIIEFVVKHMSNLEQLSTDGRTLFITRGDEIIAMIETCEEPALKEQEKELIVQLSMAGD